MMCESGKPAFSVIIPARNEEVYIGDCLESIAKSADGVLGDVEIVVVINRCTDRTEEIARSYGAVIAHNDTKRLGAIRNTGVAASSSDNLVFIDADSVMPPGLLARIYDQIENSAPCGGVEWEMDRTSVGIRLTMAIAKTIARMLRIMAIVMWTTRDIFDEIGGFDEERPAGEDIDFARRLRKTAILRGKEYRIIRDMKIVTSSRKFDYLGDWYVFKHPLMGFRLFKGKDPESADRIWYDVER